MFTKVLVSELKDMKEAVVTICSKELDKFLGQSKVSTDWFKLDSGFFLNNVLQFIQNSIKKIEKDIEDQDKELYITFIVPFDR